MKKKNAPVRARNTLAKRLRNCSTNEERWFLLHTGSPCPSELARLFFDVLEERNAEGKWYFSGSNLTNDLREIFAKWRVGLEQRTGKLILPILMSGDAKALRDLADTVERMEALNADCPPETDSLRPALLKLFRHRVSPWRTTWQELEEKLAEPELHVGGHDRNHIRRVMKQLGIWKLIQIPAKRKRNVNRTAKHPHERGWRYDRKTATTVIGRKPGESCLLSLQDDRNSPAAAGQEYGMREPNGFLNGGQPRSQKRATPCIREWCRFQPLSWPSGNRVQQHQQ